MKKVLILMSTYNGSKYLPELLDSLINQKKVLLDVLVRDDCSQDNTIDILESYKNRLNITLITGENLKPAKSFMELIKNASTDYDYYAYCDQDDVWLSNKLSKAISFDKDDDNFYLYYGSPRVVDKNLNDLPKPSISLCKMMDFFSCIESSNAVGCTMVFNKQLMKKLKSNIPNWLPMHDEWTHKVCLALGGNVYFDDDVPILYRQHENNTVGIKVSSLNQKIRFFWRSLRKKECFHSKTLFNLYSCFGQEMVDKYKKTCYIGANYKASFINWMKFLFNFRIHSKYFRFNLTFRILVLFRSY